MKLDHNKDSQEIIDENVETDEKWKQTNENKKAALDAMEKGEYQKAAELFTKAIKLNPHFTNLYVCRASAFLKLHMPIAAVKDCNKVQPKAQKIARLRRKQEEKVDEKKNNPLLSELQETYKKQERSQMTSAELG
uniref:Uncharacterized protein n=1 Tax=Pseudonaja textilis TaxID=8673 RepID=A0A670Y1D3_PSETE